MQDLNLVLVQANLAWEDAEKNRKAFSNKFTNMKPGTDLVILPEMFNTGFTMNTATCAEPDRGPTFLWMKHHAAELNCAIAGSILTRSGKHYVNRMYWVNPDGNYHYYDKKHLFSMAGENVKMTAGIEQKVVEFRGWRFCLQICYDLRFPAWSLNQYLDGNYRYDALIYVANWPEVRNHVYETLVAARAIENQSYVVWVNRVGSDGNGVIHSGDSQVVDPYGAEVCRALPGKEQLLEAQISMNKLKEFRKKFNLGPDWDYITVH